MDGVDCCCCCFFLYLLFDSDGKPPHAPTKLEPTAKTSANYCYFNNMSAGSSIDSKSSWIDRYCPKRDNNAQKDNSTGDDDDDSDGWMASAPLETSASHNQIVINSQTPEKVSGAAYLETNLIDYNETDAVEGANYTGSGDGGAFRCE